MKKGVFVVCAAILCVILSATFVMAQEAPKKFTLKLGVGYAGISGGDLTSMINGVNELLRDIAGLAGATISGKLVNAKWGLELDEELVYNITGRFGVSLGVGYIRTSADGQAEMRAGTQARILFGWEPVVIAVPVTLSGHYRFPVASRLNVFARAGVGYYFATLDYKTLEESELYGVSLWAENEGTAKKGGWGFQGGLGLAVNVSGRLALFIEGSGRYVNLTDWDINNLYQNSYGSERHTGTFWYVEKNNEDTGKTYPGLELGDREPSGPSFRNVRKAEISLSGVVFKTGVIFRF